MAVAALNLGPGAGRRFFLEFTEADGTRRREPLSPTFTHSVSWSSLSIPGSRVNQTR
jgi:hypothetical protein